MTPQHINQWADRWQLPPQCLAELMYLMGTQVPPDAPPVGTGAEATVQQARRLQIAKEGGRLWRNNTGVAFNEQGVPTRFGLSNDSEAVNKVCKSSDLIGITPTRCACGRFWGVFTAEECKHPKWRFTGTEREIAQFNFIQLVISLGGFGRFVTRGE